MLPSVPTMLSTEMHNMLKDLHGRLQAHGHNLAWFLDQAGRVRLLVTIASARETISYRTGDETHVITLASDRRFADLDLSPFTVRMLGVEGLLAYIEKELGVTVAPEIPGPAMPARNVA